MGKRALVILGAGASYDCDVRGVLPASGVRMPLVDQLFDERIFSNVLADIKSRGHRYGGALALGHLYLSQRNKRKLTLEKFIDDILINKKLDKSYMRYVKNVRELISYMRILIGGIGDRIRDMAPHTGFHNLVNHFSVPDYDRVTFVTTNYDLLLDRALMDLIHMPLHSLDGYINHDDKWCLVKLHGSVNWVREIQEIHYPNIRYGNINDLLDTVCSIDPESKFLSEIKIGVFEKHYEHRWNDKTLLYPVMVLPTVIGKKFVCPDSHVASVTRNVQEADEAWIIGNSLSDEDVSSLIRANAVNVKNVIFVDRSYSESKDKESAMKHVLSHFQNEIELKAHFCGFRNFVLDVLN